MDTKDTILIGTNIVGWTLAVLFFVLKRRHDKSDKALEKRFEVYSAFLKKSDELNEGIRKDPNTVYGVSGQAFAEIISNSGDQQKINESLIAFNERLIAHLKQSMKPLQILSTEVNSLTLIASDELLKKLNEFKQLSTDLSNEFQNVLATISPSDSAGLINKLETMGHGSRAKKYAEIYDEMVTLMRKEMRHLSK